MVDQPLAWNLRLPGRDARSARAGGPRKLEPRGRGEGGPSVPPERAGAVSGPGAPGARGTGIEGPRAGSDLRLIRELAASLAGVTDSAEATTAVLRCALQAASEGGVAARASLLRLEGDEALVVAQYGDVADRGHEPCRLALDQHPMLARVAGTGAPFAGPLEPLAMPDKTRELVRARGLADSVVVAVRVRGRTVGLLAVSSRGRSAFSPREVEQLGAIAGVAGLAMDSAEHIERLRRDADRLSTLERTKSDFLRLASHELRAPLGILGGYLSMVADGVFGDLRDVDISAPLPMMVAKVREISSLIDQMLDTARLEDLRLELAREDLDLRDLVREAVAGAGQRGLRRHRVRALVGRGPLPVRADQRRVMRILDNLVDNAIKYSPEGGEVRVAARRLGADARVSVVDRGLGIAPDQLSVLFTRFGRVSTPETRHISGVGLGLYLARELARLHGGDITVRSTPGRGSTFTLRIPLSGADDAIRVPAGARGP